jgi:hypothetical protein
MPVVGVGRHAADKVDVLTRRSPSVSRSHGIFTMGLEGQLLFQVSDEAKIGNTTTVWRGPKDHTEVVAKRAQRYK